MGFDLPMLTTAAKWCVPLGALFVLGPLAAALPAALTAPDGSGEATLLIGQSLFMGLAAGVVALLLAGLAGVVGATLGGTGAGFFSAGMVLVWAAWVTARVDRLLAVTGNGSTLWVLALEGALVGIAGVVLAWVIVLAARRADHPGSQRRDDASLVGTVLPGIALAVIAGGLASWLVAQDFLKGQTFAAAACAGMLGATAGRVGAHRASPVVFFVGIAVLAVASPVAAAFIHGTGDGPLRAAYDGSLLPMARILPLDWIAGAFVGVPLGLAWAGSMIDRHTDTD